MASLNSLHCTGSLQGIINIIIHNKITFRFPEVFSVEFLVEIENLVNLDNLTVTCLTLTSGRLDELLCLFEEISCDVFLTFTIMSLNMKKRNDIYVNVLLE